MRKKDPLFIEKWQKQLVSQSNILKGLPQTNEKYQEVKGICKDCGKHFEYDQMEGDHIVPWHDGGKTEIKNLQMLCKHCNRTKSGK